MRKVFILTIIIVFALILPVTAYAQNSELDIDDNIGLGQINISTFPQPDLSIDPSFTIFSWLSWIGTLASFGIVAFWIYLVLKAAFGALKSEGEPEKLEEAFSSVRSAFIGASIALVFPIILTILGYIFGLGPLWSWPSAFRQCESTNESAFFFQEVFRQADAGSEDPVADAEFVCGL